MKSKRQEKILELIADHSVQTQEQLLAELNEAGFSTTQATIPATSSSCASSRNWGLTAFIGMRLHPNLRNILSLPS